MKMKLWYPKFTHNKLVIEIIENGKIERKFAKIDFGPIQFLNAYKGHNPVNCCIPVPEYLYKFYQLLND